MELHVLVAGRPVRSPTASVTKTSVVPSPYGSAEGGPGMGFGAAPGVLAVLRSGFEKKT